jgi:hypothetical protein
MTLDANLLKRLEGVLASIDDAGGHGPRLMDDARRLRRRLGKFADLALTGPQIDLESLELACYALQLPARQTRGATGGKLGGSSLRDRCQQAAELLVSVVGDIQEDLLDRTTRILLETPQKSPKLQEARLLADAINLEDFGITGLVQQTTQLALQGEGVSALLTAMEKRQQYGYWEIRLKEGFHFEPVRRIARRRLDSALQTIKFLETELQDDGA